MKTSYLGESCSFASVPSEGDPREYYTKERLERILGQASALCQDSFLDMPDIPEESCDLMGTASAKKEKMTQKAESKKIDPINIDSLKILLKSLQVSQKIKFFNDSDLFEITLSDNTAWD